MVTGPGIQQPSIIILGNPVAAIGHMNLAPMGMCILKRKVYSAEGLRSPS